MAMPRVANPEKNVRDDRRVAARNATGVHHVRANPSVMVPPRATDARHVVSTAANVPNVKAVRHVVATCLNVVSGPSAVTRPTTANAR